MNKANDSISRLLFCSLLIISLTATAQDDCAVVDKKVWECAGEYWCSNCGNTLPDCRLATYAEYHASTCFVCDGPCDVSPYSTGAEGNSTPSSFNGAGLMSSTPKINFGITLEEEDYPLVRRLALRSPGHAATLLRYAVADDEQPPLVYESRLGISNQILPQAFGLFLMRQLSERAIPEFRDGLRRSFPEERKVPEAIRAPRGEYLELVIVPTEGQGSKRLEIRTWNENPGSIQRDTPAKIESIVYLTPEPERSEVYKIEDIELVRTRYTQGTTK